MGYVFISYSTKNQATADALKHLFDKNGINSWMAPGDIPAGSKYAQVINKAIKGCSCVVLLLTDASQSSTWVSKEIERAINYKKIIVPMQLEDIVLNDEFEFYISTDQIVAVQLIDEDLPEIKKILENVAVYCGSNMASIQNENIVAVEHKNVTDVRYRINFGIQFLGGKDLKLYDHMRIDVSDEFHMSFFRNGDYIYKTVSTNSTLTDLGLDETECVKVSKDLLECLYPNRNIIAADNFYTKIYSDLSGGFRLDYIVK